LTKRRPASAPRTRVRADEGSLGGRLGAGFGGDEGRIAELSDACSCGLRVEPLELFPDSGDDVPVEVRRELPELGVELGEVGGGDVGSGVSHGCLLR
jgi:hypothetical protein